MRIKSISKRLAIRITLLILSFSVVLLLANTLLLKPLYYRSVKNDMVDGIEQLVVIDYLETSGDWENQILIDPGHSYDITVEYEGEIIYSSSMDIGIRGVSDGTMTQENKIHEPLNEKLPDNKVNIIPAFPIDSVEDWEDINGVMIGTLHNERDNLNLFVAQATSEDGVEIYLTQGIEPVLNSVRQANILLMIVSGIFLVIAMVVAFLLSLNFSKPIRQMQAHVMKLSKLEFGQQIHIDTKDELEDLGRDINILSGELQNALTTLKLQNKQLEKDVKAQRKFISNASHELRTPLALIKGYADEIAGGLVKNRDQEHIYVGYIAEESTKMKRLLNEILELSRLESGRMNLQAMNHEIGKIIQGFLEKYSGFIEEHRLKIHFDSMEGIGYFDSVKFEQVLANYISNAGKYSDSKKEVIIRCEDMNDCYRIIVKNSGGPISRQVMDYIWDGFYKADEARTDTDGSYGLGLSIVKAIQELSEQAFGCYNEDGYVVFWFEVAKRA